MADATVALYEKGVAVRNPVGVSGSELLQIARPLAAGMSAGAYAAPLPKVYAPSGFTPKMVESRLKRISTPNFSV